MTSMKATLMLIGDDIAAIALALVLLYVLSASGVISAAVAILIGLAAVAFFSFVAYETCRLQSMKPKVGIEAMVGKRGKVVCDLAPEGAIDVDGEYWKAFSDSPVRKGSIVEVAKVDSQRVKVKKVDDEERR